VLDASRYTLQNPVDAAKIFLPYAPGATAADLEFLLRYHTHGHNPVGARLKQEIALYANELRQVNVFKRTTDPVKFADRVYADVLSA
jgi:NitT/TauT family transport system substrate-binding protein